MTERDWRIFREDNQIQIKGGKVIQPIRNWREVKKMINDNLYEQIRKLYKKPTAIQMQGIPIGLQRKDLIGLAPTGSGKSAAFLIPLIHFLQEKQPLDPITSKDGPYALIMSPSRELAIQINDEFNKININQAIRSQVIIGGKWLQEQGVQLSQGCEVIIGTPGRIKDAFQEMYLAFNQCDWVVLDEADKMIEQGFEEDIRFILDSFSKSNLLNRTTHLYSATMPGRVERLAKTYLRSFCYISIGDPGQAKKDINQIVDFIADGNKKSRLIQILRQEINQKIIIFLNNRSGVDNLQTILEASGFNCVSYHGGKNQQKREEAIIKFRNNNYNILIATDLAGRGLDIEGVTAVVNYDCPKTMSDLIHRTGRTGRAGKKGTAYTFITNSNADIFYDLREFLFKNNYKIPEELNNHQQAKIKPGTIDQVPRRKQILYCQ